MVRGRVPGANGSLKELPHAIARWRLVPVMPERINQPKARELRKQKDSAGVAPPYWHATAIFAINLPHAANVLISVVSCPASCVSGHAKDEHVFAENFCWTCASGPIRCSLPSTIMHSIPHLGHLFASFYDIGGSSFCSMHLSPPPRCSSILPLPYVLFYDV